VSLTTISRTERGVRPNHEFAATYRAWLNDRTPATAA
jgi:transposase